MPRSSTTWQPGQSGNPGGRPKRALTEILARAGSASGAKPEQLFRFLMRTRRNLTDDQRAMLADQERELLVRQSMRERVANVRGATSPVAVSHDVCDTGDGRQGRDTRAEVADRASVPRRKLDQAKAVREKRPDLARRVVSGEYVRGIGKGGS